MFYDGSHLLSLKDINGKEPEIYLCTSNRSAGKTTFFGRYLVNQFKRKKKKFGLLYRYSYELSDCEDKFFAEIGRLFFPNDAMTAESRARGKFKELFLNEEPCGYAIAINDSENIKKLSHLMADMETLFFDEFQSESGKYVPDEIKKFVSIHFSLARGGGKAVKHLPVIMCGNTVTLINPYYTALGISERLRNDTKFLRGNGFVLEAGFVASVGNEQKKSGFNRAFAGNSYIQYASENVYLNDNRAFIEKPNGKSNYLATVKCDGKNYGIREFPEFGFVYCDNKPDMTFPLKISVTTDEHETNYIMLRNNDNFLRVMRFYFERGCFRFKNIECKHAILKTLTL